MTSTTHHVEATIHRAADEVTELLGSRSRSWLGAFLLLSAGASVTRGQPSGSAAKCRFRLGRPSAGTADPDGARVQTSSFMWRPAGAVDLFERFDGAVRVRPDESQCVLELVGASTGGVQSQNEKILRDLVRMLAAAMSFTGVPPHQEPDDQEPDE